jgi:hypothetical protein
VEQHDRVALIEELNKANSAHVSEQNRTDKPSFTEKTQAV